MEQYKFNELIEYKRIGCYERARAGYIEALRRGDRDTRIFSALAKVFFLEGDYYHVVNTYIVYFRIQRERGIPIYLCENEIFHAFMGLFRYEKDIVLERKPGYYISEAISNLLSIELTEAYIQSIAGMPLGPYSNMLMLSKNEFFSNDDNLLKDYTINYMNTCVDINSYQSIESLIHNKIIL